jgi:two-component system CheB/CheR fusion protein
VTSARFPIVGIGASAGGIEAFRLLFGHMPPDSGMAFIVMLHRPPESNSVLSGVLGRWTSMPVLDASDGTPIEPNHVYVPPPHCIVTVADGRISAEQPPDKDRIYHPIDGFFDSLGTAAGELAVGIVLSGTGSDGALGLKALKERGGLTIAQGKDGTIPQYGEMPAGAIATGAVDLVVPVEEIPGHLLRLKNTPIERLPEGDSNQASETDRLTICDLLRTHVGHDFSGYRSQTFLRRVARRMAVVNVTGLQDYIAKLKADPAEITALFRDLLIRVTSFFRDQQTFETLAAKVIPTLFEGKGADSTVRIWVPGCATGEEAYSLAMLLREQMDSLPAPPKVQVFATDIDDAAIATARHGRYPKTLLEGLSKERLRRLLGSQHGTRPAFFDDEPGLVPQFTHIHEPGAAGTDHPAVSLLACSWRHTAVGQFRVRGAAPRSV